MFQTTIISYTFFYENSPSVFDQLPHQLPIETNIMYEIISHIQQQGNV